MIVDEINLVLKAGDGGEGNISFKKSGRGPDGGNGGEGGNIYIKASSDLTLLSHYKPKKKIEAENGLNGERKKRTGRNGEDLHLVFPVGTSFQDKITGEIFELNSLDDEFLICKGGTGGIGNYDLRNSVNQAPKYTIPPTQGQKRKLKIVLRFIADYGLIGLPSVGKSSLLNALTNAHVKVGAYHFTTLSPNLGVLPSGKILADIPGLISGASKGKGLGFKFLKHIQKVDMLLHCISFDSKDPFSDYISVRNELKKFDKNLCKKEEVILLTKVDLISKKKKVDDIVKKLNKIKRKIIPVSVYKKNMLENLTKILN